MLQFKDVQKNQSKINYKANNEEFSLFSINLFDFKIKEYLLDESSDIIIKCKRLEYELFLKYFNNLFAPSIQQYNNSEDDKASLIVNNIIYDGLYFYPEFVYGNFEQYNKDKEIYDMIEDTNIIKEKLLKIINEHVI